MKHSLLKRSLCLLLAVLTVLTMPAAALEGVAEAEETAAIGEETASSDPFAPEETSEAETDEAETPESPPVEVPTVFVDKDGRYLAPETLSVYILRYMQEESLTDTNRTEDKYTGVVAFYDYSVSNEKTRLEHPYFFYYKKGELQDEEPAFVAAKGYLDLTDAPLAASAVDPAVSAEEDRLVYVAVERYVDEDADTHDSFLFAFQQTGEENGLYTGQYETETYADGVIVPAEPEAETVEPTAEPEEETTEPTAEPEETVAPAVEEEPAAETQEAVSRKHAKAPVADQSVLKTAPTVAAVIDAAGVQVSWTTDGVAKGYRVLRRAGSGSWQTLGDLTAVTGGGYLDETVSSGVIYTYAVAAYYGEPDDMAASDTTDSEVWSDTSETSPLCYLTAPKSSAAGSDASILITWSAVAGAESYSVFRSAEGGSWSNIATVQSGTLSYTDKNAKSGVHYFYTVRANHVTTGSYSLYTDTRTDPAKSVSLHATPVVTLTAETGGVRVKWGQDADANGYRLFRRAAGGRWETLANVTSGRTTNYLDKSAAYGMNYLYAVRAYYGSAKELTSASLNSGELWSGQKETDWFYYLQAPLCKTACDEQKITITWNAVSLAQNYSVFRSVEGGDWVRLGTVRGTEYIDKKVTSGVRYYYTVRANNTSKNAASATYDFRTDTSKSAFLHITPVVSLRAKDYGILVSWGRDQLATGYRIYRREPGGRWEILTNVTSSRTGSYQDKTAVYGKTYSYGVRTYYGDVKVIDAMGVGRTELWSDLEGVTLTYMTAPEITGVTSGNGYMDIKWKPVANATGYMIYRRTSLNGAWVKLATVQNVTSYKDKTAVNGKTYYYGVKAYKTESKTLNSYSDQIVYETGYTYHAPLEMRVYLVSGGSKITWTLDPAATGYRIYRKCGSEEVVLRNVSAKSLQSGDQTVSYTDSARNLTGGETYYYTVRAYYGSDAVASASTAGGLNWGGYAYYKVIYLAAPKVNAVAENDPTGIKVKWDTVAGATGYQILRRTESGSWARVSTVSSGTTNAYIDKTAAKLAAGTVLYYTVIAISETGSPNSSYDAVGAYAVYLPKPQDVNITVSGSSGTTMTWSAVQGAQFYDIYRRVQDSSSWTLITSVEGTTYVDPSATSAGDRFVYTIRPRVTAEVNGRTLTVTGCYEQNGYLAGIPWSGKERQEWVNKDGTQYYVSKDGMLLTGWQYITRNGRRCKYYFDEDTGALVTNLYSYFGKEYRDMKCRIELCLNTQKSNPSYVAIYLYDQATDSYCIPAISFRCIGNMVDTTLRYSHASTYLRSGSGNRWLESTNDEGTSTTYEQYATFIHGTFSQFHSVLYRKPKTNSLIWSTYNSMVRNNNNSNGCVRVQCIYAYLIQDITKNGYGRSHRIPVQLYKRTAKAGPFGVPKVDTIGKRSTEPTDPAVTGRFYYSTSIHGVGAEAGAKRWTYY